MQETLEYLNKVTFGLLRGVSSRLIRLSNRHYHNLNYWVDRRVSVFIDDVYIGNAVMNSIYINEMDNPNAVVVTDQYGFVMPASKTDQMRRACEKESHIQLKFKGVPALTGKLYGSGRAYSHPPDVLNSSPGGNQVVELDFSAYWEELQDPKLRYLFVQGLHELAERKRKPSERIA